MGYSIFFDGSGDYLLANANSGSFGTADFTVEAFVKLADPTSNKYVVSNYNTYNSNSFALIANHTNATLKYSVALGSTGFPNIAGVSRPSTNKFDHVAVTRQGNTVTLYVNGNREGSAVTFTGNLTHSSGNTWIGTDPVPTQTYFKGWINGVRIIKNECIYTANFTPPTILTLTTNTTLLTCNVDSLNVSTNTCIDQSNLGYSITTFGDVGVAADGINFSNTLIAVPIYYSVGETFNISNTLANTLIAVPINYDVDYSGDGKIFGTVKKRISKVNVPLADTKVYLYTIKNKIALKETTSNTTGHFLFENLNRNEKYYVSAFDPVSQETAVIADNITPDPM